MAIGVNPAIILVMVTCLRPTVLWYSNLREFRVTANVHRDDHVLGLAGARNHPATLRVAVAMLTRLLNCYQAVL